MARADAPLGPGGGGFQVWDLPHCSWFPSTYLESPACQSHISKHPCGPMCPPRGAGHYGVCQRTGSHSSSLIGSGVRFWGSYTSMRMRTATG